MKENSSGLVSPGGVKYIITWCVYRVKFETPSKYTKQETELNDTRERLFHGKNQLPQVGLKTHAVSEG